MDLKSTQSSNQNTFNRNFNYIVLVTVYTRFGYVDVDLVKYEKIL